MPFFPLIHKSKAMNTINKYSQRMALKAGLFCFFTTTAFFGLTTVTIFAQNTSFWNREMGKIAKPSSKEGWIDFKEEAQLNPQTLFIEHGEAFGLGPDDVMRLKEVSQDKYGYTHYRFEQLYKGVKVTGGTFVVHADASNQTQSANGRVATGLTLQVSPGISEQNALETAKGYADGTDFLWLDQNAEQALKEMEKDPDATYFPQGELVIVRSSANRNSSDSKFALAWQFDLYMGLKGEARRIQVDAHTGQFLNYTPISFSCNPGSGTTTWNGVRSISTDEEGSVFILLDDCEGSHPYQLKTWDLQRTSSAGNRIDYEDGDNDWTTLSDRTGVQTHWGIHETRDYYFFSHERQSWNGQNGSANWVAYNEAQMDVNDVLTHNNACWNCFPNVAAFGGGDSATDPGDDWNTLDIVGHEFTHGVTRTEADLEYEGESGALNESFSDIFGEMVELSATGVNDWLVGAERGNAIRSFSAPNSEGDPDTYLGDFWYSGTADNGGVHRNSSVQNFWFFLLSVGGTGTNDFSENYSVQGIGTDKAAEIAYLALTEYLTEFDEYIDAREATLKAAREIFGACSTEEIQVGKAWFAVHVGNVLEEFNYEVCGTQEEGTFQGINSVIGGGSCTTTIEAFSENVTFYAGNYIRLRPGFTADASGVNRFRAAIESCSFTVRSSDFSSNISHNHPFEEWLDSDPANKNEIGVSSQQTNAIVLDVQPNPFITSTIIRFELEDPMQISLEVLDLNGRLVQSLITAGQMGRGQQQVAIDALSLPNGIYLCKLIAGTQTITKKIVKVN